MALIPWVLLWCIGVREREREGEGERVGGREGVVLYRQLTRRLPVIFAITQSRLDG